MTFEEHKHEVPGQRLYLGVAIAQVRMINPTIKELVAAKIYQAKAVEEGRIPVPADYGPDNNGQFRLDFHLQVQPEIKGKSYDSFYIKKSFWVSNEDFQNKEGNPMYMNAFGRTCKKEHYDALPAVDKKEWHVAKVGEQALTEFVRIAADLKSTEPTPELNFAALAVGGLNTLAAIFSTPRFTKEMLGINLKRADEGKYYQDSFTKRSTRTWSEKYEYIYNDLKYFLENGGAEKKYFGVNVSKAYNPEAFELRLFVAGEEKSLLASSFDSVPVVQEDEDDGLPF